MGWLSDATGGWGGDKLLDFGSGWFGQKEQNRENVRQVKDLQYWQQGNADTQYQRAAADLKKAGINPILAGQFGGASTPAGAVANMGNMMQSGFDAASSGASTSNTESKTKLIDLDLIIKDPEAILAKGKSIAYKVIYEAALQLSKNPKASNQPLAKKTKDALVALNSKSKTFIKGFMEWVNKTHPKQLPTINQTLQSVLNPEKKGAKRVN